MIISRDGDELDISIGYKCMRQCVSTLSDKRIFVIHVERHEFHVPSQSYILCILKYHTLDAKN